MASICHILPCFAFNNLSRKINSANRAKTRKIGAFQEEKYHDEDTFCASRQEANASIEILIFANENANRKVNLQRFVLIIFF